MEVIMKKKLLLILLALALAFSMFACTGDGDPEKCAKCVDNDGDGFCDKCDELVAKHRCKDKDKDGECDECGVARAYHSDEKRWGRRCVGHSNFGVVYACREKVVGCIFGGSVCGHANL